MSKDLKNRNLSLDLLRILTMFGIVICHYCGHGIKNNNVLVVGGTFVNRLVLQIGSDLNIGNTIFFMFMGFFLYDKKQKLIKIKDLIFIMYFYIFLSLFIWLIIKFLWGGYSFPEVHTVGVLGMSMFPVGHQTWWFVSVYIWIYLVFDKLNVLLNKLTKRPFLMFIIMFGLEFAPNIIPEDFSLLQYGIFGYSLGFYSRLLLENKEFNNKVNNKKLFLLFCVSSMLFIFIEIFIVGWEGCNEMLLILLNAVKIGFLGQLSAFFIFNIFARIYIKSNVFNMLIIAFSKATFGVYLLHDCPFSGRILLYKLFFSPEKNYLSNFFPILLFIDCLIIFLSCTIIELFRERLFSFIKNKRIFYDN